MVQDLQSIQQIFQDKVFTVPDYQRGYAWEIKHWEDMIEDIDLMEDNQEHYTGTLVIHAPDNMKVVQDDDLTNYWEFEIVDGQQRLTTMTVLLAVIARELGRLGGKGKQMAQGIRKNYICTKVDGADRPKLTLNRDTNDFYKRSIISDRPGVSGPKIMSEQRLLDALSYFTEYFNRKSEELGDGYLVWLNRTYDKISQRMKLVVYQVKQESEVGVIFEVMNNRGKQLTEMEKVKNYLLYLASKLTCGGGQDLAQAINQAWTSIFEELMTARGFSAEHENQLLRNNWLMSRNYNPKQWDGSDSVKKQFSLKGYKGRHNELRDDVRDYVRLLEESCTSYCDIIAPRRAGAFSMLLHEEELQKQIVDLTDKLLRIGAVSSFVPLLMAVRIRYGNNYQLYLDYLELCEKFAFRVYRFAEKRSNTGQTTLFRFGHEVFHDSVSEQTCYERIVWLLLNYAPNGQFEAEIERLGKNWYNWYGLKYMMYEYELHLAGKKPVKMEWMTLSRKDKQDTIEHILPQTPSREYWQTRWSPDQMMEATNDIGNLTLTFDNSVYGNKGFDEKRGDVNVPNCYAHSIIFMEKEVARYSDWTYDEFLHRRKKIAKWMRVRWHVDEAKKLDIEIEEDVDIDEIAEESL